MYRAVKVTWLDIAGHDTRPWMDPEEAQALRPACITTVGIIISETDNYITIAGSWEDDYSTLGNINCIPTGVVEDVTYLGPQENLT